MDSFTPKELRELFLQRFGIELEGRIYRLQFEFKESSCYLKLFEEMPKSKEQIPIPKRYILQVQEVGETEKSEIEFSTPDSMQKAFKSYKLLKRFSVWYLVDGIVEGCCLAEKW